jgi:hypothetical protein
LISVIFRSEGAEDFGVLSIAFSKPLPKFEKGAASAPVASALFVRKDRLEVDIFFRFKNFGFMSKVSSLGSARNLEPET